MASYGVGVASYGFCGQIYTICVYIYMCVCVCNQTKRIAKNETSKNQPYRMYPENLMCLEWFSAWSEPALRWAPERFPCGLSPADIIGIIGHTVGFESGDLGGNDKWKASTSSLSHPAAMCRGSAPLLSPQWKHHLDLPRVDFNWTNTNIPFPDFYIPPKLGPQNE